MFLYAEFSLYCLQKKIKISSTFKEFSVFLALPLFDPHFNCFLATARLWAIERLCIQIQVNRFDGLVMG